MQDEVESQAEKLRQMSRMLAEQRVAHASQAKQLKALKHAAATPPSPPRPTSPLVTSGRKLRTSGGGGGQIAEAARKRLQRQVDKLAGALADAKATAETDSELASEREAVLTAELATANQVRSVPLGCTSCAQH